MTIDIARAAMLVVELQNDLVHQSLCDERGLRGALARAVRDRRVLENLAPVLEACRARGVPVVYLPKERHPSLPWPDHAPIYRAAREPILAHGTDGARFVEEIAPRDVDLVLPRFTSIDPSHGSTLWPTLRNLGVDTVMLAGVSTTLAVEGVTRAAVNRGYRVVVLEDCCASVPEEWHRFSIDKVLPLIAEVLAGGTVIDALERRSRASDDE